MPLREAFRLALQVIWAQKMKSFFSVIGVFIGVTFLIAVVSIVEGMDRYMTEDFAGALLGVNTFQLRRYPGMQMEDVSRETRRRWRRRPRISYDDARAVAEGLTVPALTAWESYNMVDIGYGGRVARDINVYGTTEQYFQIKSWEIAEGRPFSAQEARAGQAVVVIGYDLADRLFEGRDPLGQDVRIRGIPYRVIGVVEPQGNIFGISLDKFAVAPALSPIKRVVNPPRVIDALLVKTETVGLLQAAIVETEAIMRSRRQLRPTEENEFSVETSEGVLDFWGNIKKFLVVMGPGLVSISLVVGGIVIMNIMLMAVSERTREIGIRKALGARRSDIMRQFLVEAAALATLGAALGIGTGIALAAVIDATTFLPIQVSPFWMSIGVLVGGGVGIGAGLYPAGRAARLDPVEAIRQE